MKHVGENSSTFSTLTIYFLGTVPFEMSIMKYEAKNLVIWPLAYTNKEDTLREGGGRGAGGGEENGEGGRDRVARRVRRKKGRKKRIRRKGRRRRKMRH